MKPIFFSFLGILFLFSPIKGSPILIGNPAQPGLQNGGIIRETPSSWSFRISYFGDYVYNQRFHDEFPICASEETPSQIKFWTQAGMLTFNFRDSIDLYGIVGGLQLQLDEEILTKQQLAWGVGGKIVFYHEGKFRAGCDIKYFQSNQTPSFFQCDHSAYNVTSNFSLSYSELQAALGLSYRTKYFSPYASATYLIAKLSPSSNAVYLRFPMVNMEIAVPTKSVIASRKFGLALGATLIDKRKASLAVEWRAFNQNSIDVTGEVRF